MAKAMNRPPCRCESLLIGGDLNGLGRAHIVMKRALHERHPYESVLACARFTTDLVRIWIWGMNMKRVKSVASYHSALTLRSKMRRDVAAPPAWARQAQRTGSWFGASAVAAFVAVGFYGGAVHATSRLQVLYSCRPAKGVYPVVAPALDGAGNLFVSAGQGGASDAGVVVELSPPKEGQAAWTKTVLHSFEGADGKEPGTDLTLDGAGNLYGGTFLGGPNGFGVLFELSPPAPGKLAWKETVLHSFDGADGNSPETGLIPDGAGNFYGTTDFGGANNDGVVFELSPPATGKKAWIVTVLHSFGGTDGQLPAGRLLADGVGDLYGTTYEGGAHGDGVVFKLSPPSEGNKVWTETVLHSFDGDDGKYADTRLIADGAGNLYGTTFEGGKDGYGVAFELSPPREGKATWTEKVLHSFEQYRSNPVAGLVADGRGDFYGISYGNRKNGDGLIYELSPPAEGKRLWTETVLYKFINGRRGSSPYGGMTFDGAGNLYGTMELGGKDGEGVVFKLTP